jgi:hypothetical protein
LVSIIGLLRSGAGTSWDLEVAFLTPKGASVARERPTASDVSPLSTVLDVRPARGGPDRPDALTHAQARALRRCAPLTSADFNVRGREVQQRTLSLRQFLARGGGATNTGATADSRRPWARTHHD